MVSKRSLSSLRKTLCVSKSFSVPLRSDLRFVLFHKRKSRGIGRRSPRSKYRSLTKAKVRKGDPVPAQGCGVYLLSGNSFTKCQKELQIVFIHQVRVAAYLSPICLRIDVAHWPISKTWRNSMVTFRFFGLDRRKRSS